MEANDTTQGRYRKSFLRFMSFKNNTNYPETHTFTNKELLTITPTDVITYLRFMAYGSPIYEPGMKLIRRSTTIKTYKRDISHHMIHQQDKWNVATQSGDPTKSKEVYKLLAIMQAAEAKGTGKTSLARRALQLSEFEQMFKILQKTDCHLHSISYASYVKLQFHMIARLDDIAHIKYSIIDNNVRYPFFPKMTIEWSKNIKCEHQQETQLLMGANDSNFCVLLSLALHMELFASSPMGMNSEFIFGLHGQGETIPKTTKAAVYATLRKLFDSAEFKSEMPGLLGSHSTRKGASNYAQECGHPRCDCEMRGRWSGNDANKGSTPYFKKTVHFTDVKVASSLCIGGVVKYDYHTECMIDDEFIVTVVAPAIARKLPRPVAVTFGKALLWAICSNEHKLAIPTWLKERFYNGYKDHVGEICSSNPICKIRVEGVGHNNKVEFVDVMSNNTLDTTSAVPSGQFHASQMTALQSSMMQLQASIQIMSNQMEMMQKQASDNTKLIRGDVKKLSKQPFWQIKKPKNYSVSQVSNATQVETVGTTLAEKVAPAKLSARPSNLYELWAEWEFGLAGNKPAKSFNPAERGKCKFVYCRRKRAWDLMSSMVARGIEINDAIKRIYSAFGENRTTTQIIADIQSWKKKGGHPNLVL